MLIISVGFTIANPVKFSQQSLREPLFLSRYPSQYLSLVFGHAVVWRCPFSTESFESSVVFEDSFVHSSQSAHLLGESLYSYRACFAESEYVSEDSFVFSQQPESLSKQSS